MADLINTAYAVIFVGVLLLVGVLIMAYVADPMGDQWHPSETVVAAGCSDDNASTEGTLCTGTINNIPIENTTRAQPVVTNCSSDGVTCQTMTVGTHYNFSVNTGSFSILLDAIGDQYNGTIKIDYWENTASASADNAQQSITGTAYGGFDLAIVMIIVMAAVGIISTIFLIGKPE